MDNIRNFKKENIKQDSLLLANKNSIQLTEDVAKFLGIENGFTQLQFVKNGNKLEIYPNIHSLAKVYIEPTAKCNLNCKTCVRGTWQEKMENMDLQVFDALINQLEDFNNIQSIMFGGFGEPTFHPNIIDMVKQVKSLGIKAEITTNGTLLNKKMLDELSKNKLDTLWISFDGATPECFEDIRTGANFEFVLENMKRFKIINGRSSHKVKVGINFVITKENIEELLKLKSLAQEIGAEEISVSNVLPYNSEMLEQMLCNATLEDSPYGNGLSINLPFLDWDKINLKPLLNMLGDIDNIYIMNQRIDRKKNSCRFIKDRSTVIKWDGNVSPCMGLLHSYETFLAPNNIKRKVESYSLGNIKERRLKEIWYSDEYRKFRDRVNDFDFSPCFYCLSCQFALDNIQDCSGNTFPSCGGCLWAQGVIQCP